MKHDQKCEFTELHRGCQCASRAFVKSFDWKQCLGRDPRISEEYWLQEAKLILASVNPTSAYDRMYYRMQMEGAFD